MEVEDIESTGEINEMAANDADDEKNSDSDETDEEIEPKLCYERVVNDVPNILKGDAASCIAVHTKFLALGTHLGVIHILDHQGNNIRNKELLLHVTTVNQISIEDRGDYLASCSNDGKVSIHGLYATDLNTTVTIERPVRSVSLDPNFSKSSSNRRFIIGEDKVVLYERQFLTGYKANVLYQGEGAIRNIKWKDRFVVWCSDKTVRVYDIMSHRVITVIPRDHDPTLRSDLYRCNFHWKDDLTLLIGWANTVKVCQVVPFEGPKTSLTSIKEQSQPPRYFVKITSIFNTDFYICGISSFDSNITLLTVMINPEDSVAIGSRPQLRVVDPNGEEYFLISSDMLTLRGYQDYRCNDYHLGSLAEEGLYFILSLKDFVVAKPRNEDDHIAWLLEHERFKEAVEAVEKSKNLKKYSLLDVGNIYLEHFFELKQYEEAAKLCSTIFGNDKEVWENGVYRFAEIGQLRAIAKYVPTKVQENLTPAIYEMILNEFLLRDQKGFFNLICTWPPSIYSVPAIISIVSEKLLSSPRNNILLESLVELYIYDKKFDKALNILIDISSKDRVFKLIETHQLFSSIHDKLETLVALNSEVATQMLIKHVDKIPVNLVVSKLKHKHLYEYLHKAFLKDPTLGEEHHGLMVELYAEHEPKQLLSFLRIANNYSLEKALDICQQRSFIKEVIFLLGRMGNTKQALHKIMDNLQDIDQAIEFCKEHDDKELWEDLIEYSLNIPGFITVLLQNIGTHVDPIMLIQRIPEGLEIPGLRDSLVKIMHDYTLQRSLQKGCKKILVNDCYSLLTKLNRLHKRGILVKEDQACAKCDNRLNMSDSRIESDVVVFYCKHAFHGNCIQAQKLATCCICSAQEKRVTSEFKK